MRRVSFLCLVSSILLFSPIAANAQAVDGLPELLTSNLLMNSMNNIGLQNTLPPSRRAPGYGNRPANQGRINAELRSGQNRPTTPVSVTPLTYRVDPAITRVVRTEIIARAARNNAAYGTMIQNFFAGNDPANTFRSYSRMTGIPIRDVSSSMAMYMVFGWATANGVVLSERNSDHVAGVVGTRRQMVQILSQQEAMMDMANRQRLDEEYMHLTTLIDAGGQAARTKEGPREVAEFSDAIHADFLNQFGIDLRNMDLTADGLVAK
jgi:hypothetical protein